MTMDWNKILDEAEKDPGFKPVPADKYHVRVDKAEAIKTKDGSKDMLKVQAKIVGGPYDTKMVFTNIVFTPDNPTAVRFTIRKLKALGLSEESLRATNPSPAQIAAMIVGAEAEAEVTLGEYNGEPTNDIKALRSLLPGGGSVPAPPPIPSAAPTAADIPLPTIPDASPPATDSQEPF